ncbi:sigma-70 family RNA polymerase sigma factor [Paenibacillaceae bacterium]|nr:sigma-70 family RNA polymerase sigma factor [Paenibacillaceae bacterium]
MDNTHLFQTYSTLLFSVAYRTLGTATDAEDIVQETFADLLQAGLPPQVNNMKAYLCKIVYNKCNDRIRETIKERQTYAGPWLPEPILTDLSEQFLDRESLATAYLLLLQQLSEMERTVFILREAGGFNYREIAWIVEKTEANCRQIYRRAKQALASQPPAERLDTPHLKPLIGQFVDALQNGDLNKLVEVLADDVVFAADSGGQVKGALVPIRTSVRVSQFLMKTSSMIPHDMRTEFEQVNGNWGLVLMAGTDVLYVFSFQIVRGRIHAIYATSNPDKLAYISRQLRLT